MKTTSFSPGLRRAAEAVAPPDSAMKTTAWWRWRMENSVRPARRRERRSRKRLGLWERGWLGPQGIPIVSGNLHDSANDTSEGRGSSVPVDFHTVEHTGPEGEHDDPIDFETIHTDLPPSADDACDTEGSVRDDDADRDAFVNAAVEETRASPVKRSTGGFADEDDLFDIDEGFTEPPSKKAKSGAAPPVVAASEASAPKAAPAAQASTASSLSKGKDVPAATTTPPSDLRGVISSLEAFASQFTSLEADKVRLQKEVESSSSKLDGAVKIAAEAHQEIDSLKEELGKLKEKLKEEEASRLAAEAQAAEKDELLRQSLLALLEAANIPANALGKIPNNSPANGVSMTLASHQLTRELLEKGKGVMSTGASILIDSVGPPRAELEPENYFPSLMGDKQPVMKMAVVSMEELSPVPRRAGTDSCPRILAS
ncbi:hypothetical protein QYE76_032663 [Lolium multiflorum]|uniref:Uncharacterized protein n=1 Tax=Lolium multiflorum TaxID=4521 RepID=A0AAD8VLD2_LOLMU|nr:hypothetical protein QYE76_032663 [Lolium multiflorum]